MSLGYTGHALFKEVRDGYIYYKYSGENWNAPYEKGDALLYDGIIKINSDALSQMDIDTEINNNKIETPIKCKNEFDVPHSKEVGYIALILIYQIFREYEENGELPEKVAFIQ